MQSADHMNLRGTTFPSLLGLGRHLRYRQLKGMGIPFLGTECTELATQNTDI